MYRENDRKQIAFKDFYLPFGGSLREDNRWVILSQKIAWDEIEELYAKGFSDSGMGAPGKPLRMALGSLIIKERLQITDEEVVDQISENPYLQYFIGMDSYSTDKPFDPSLMVSFRQRLDGELLNKASEIIIRDHKAEMAKKKRKLRKRLKKQVKKKAN